MAIDIDTEAYEVADDELTAGNRIFPRFPEAQVWYVRIGYAAVHRFSHIPPACTR